MYPERHGTFKESREVQPTEEEIELLFDFLQNGIKLPCYIANFDLLNSLIKRGFVAEIAFNTVKARTGNKNCFASTVTGLNFFLSLYNSETLYQALVSHELKKKRITK